MLIVKLIDKKSEKEIQTDIILCLAMVRIFEKHTDKE